MTKLPSSFADAMADAMRLPVETPEPDWEGFGKAIMAEWQGHVDIEASEKFELALAFNLLRQIPGGFNPNKHIDYYDFAEPGDPWYESNWK